MLYGESHVSRGPNLLLGVDHLIFDEGVVEIPKNILSTCFWLKKYHAEFLTRKKISGGRNQGVAKDFLRDT